jgi:hypothetical protein
MKRLIHWIRKHASGVDHAFPIPLSDLSLSKHCEPTIVLSEKSFEGVRPANRSLNSEALSENTLGTTTEESELPWTEIFQPLQG